MDGRRIAFWLRDWGHQFVEEIVTLCVRAARADKATIEVDVRQKGQTWPSMFR
jgi:hypothetical protein